MVVKFSQPFVQVEDLNLLKGEYFIGANNQTVYNMEIAIDPVLDQTEEQVKFTWTPLSFTSESLQI